MAILLPTPQFQRPAVLTRPTQAKEVVTTIVSEAEYWEQYYADPDHHYEWNNGYLEEKGVSEKLTLFSYEWFFELLINYLRVTQSGQLMALETGFRLAWSWKTTIRKPDLGVVLNSNPVVWKDSDHSYSGICDLCVEALSDTTKKVIERDTVTKFREYAKIGVPEYYILYAYGEPQQFYRLTPAGIYVPIPPVQQDLICSTVLPGFQFRVSDLQRQPSPEEMSEDSVYRAFMLPALQAEKQARQLAERLLEQERGVRVKEQTARQVAETYVQQEREARQLAEVQAQQEQQARQLAEAQTQQEQQARQLAEVQAQQEQQARQLAEAQTQQEQQARQLAEVQAQQDRQARQAVEARFQQLEAELAQLRQQH